MTLDPVEGSSNIAAIGYDAAQQVLRVKFRGGATYDYHGITAEKHRAFVAAESKGSHLAKHIRKQHKFEKVET